MQVKWVFCEEIHVAAVENHLLSPKYSLHRPSEYHRYSIGE
uniref:Uncharacterized protein n=1 Tax=Ascaris lumbricoides TaxID=6252 RepID=A0A0M3I7B5_ASCLU